MQPPGKEEAGITAVSGFAVRLLFKTFILLTDKHL
jgi:hypothetical protein